MHYYIDFEAITMDQFKVMLKNGEQIPSWQILNDDMDARFECLKQNGIDNLAVCLNSFKRKSDITAFSEKSGLPEKYLEVLRRVVNGYKQKPNKLDDFGMVSNAVVDKLKKIGINDTYKLYNAVLTIEQRAELVRQIDIPPTDLLMLTKLADLSRIRWVNHTFACVLYKIGYDTAEKIAASDAQILYETVKQYNDANAVYKAHISVRDMKMCIDSAKLLTFEIEY